MVRGSSSASLSCLSIRDCPTPPATHLHPPASWHSILPVMQAPLNPARCGEQFMEPCPLSLIVFEGGPRCKATFQTLVRTISLQLNRRRSAGRGPGKAAQPLRGRPAGRLTAPRKNVVMMSLLASAKSSQHLNDIGISLDRREKIITPLLPGFRAVKRALVTGRTQAVQAPLTPRPRGTIYETMPFTLGQHLEGPRWRFNSKYWDSLSHITIDFDYLATKPKKFLCETLRTFRRATWWSDSSRLLSSTAGSWIGVEPQRSLAADVFR